MNYITVPVRYSSGKIELLEEIKKNPTRVMVTFEYDSNYY